MGAPLRSIHALAVTLFLTLFVALGASRIWLALRSGMVGPAVPFYSTDRDIAGLSGITNGSERIVQTLAALPGSKRLVIILPEGDAPSIYFALMIGYLGWPRTVDAIQIAPEEAGARVRQLDPATFEAILFCRIPPPAFVPAGERWAPELVFVRSPAATKGKAP